MHSHTQRFPHERVLLPRTKLAYVHLHNLLTDAKRDRSARVFGYVAIWLPEELVLLYLQSGELVNATWAHSDVVRAIPLADALARVPAEPELGEICFHEAEDEQLACMWAAQVSEPEPWPGELDAFDEGALFPFLMATTWDGMLEIAMDGGVSYAIVRDGEVERAYLADPVPGAPGEAIAGLLHAAAGRAVVRRWPIPEPIPQQAPTALVRAYRQLARRLVEALVASGRESAPDIAEHARRTLLDTHPVLEHFTVGERELADPVADVATVTKAVAAWVAEVLWALADHDTVRPETLLADLTRDRRHVFQSAGFFDDLPFKVQW
ncbi:MAG TPA: hypothetical protein VFZ11_14025 [Gemmatimonadaceae bacterium]